MVIYSFSREAVQEGNLILVNREHPLKLRRQYRSDDLAMIDVRFPEILLRNVAASHLKCIFQRIESGEKIVPVSGFRSLREQTELFDTSWAENGEEYTKKFVARPNQSEHQTGLAIDVAEYSEQIDFICPEFSYEGIAMKFREMAAEYGFIERYPKGKEEITGIAHEPWHFRYVGIPHARIISLLGLTLEEYVEFLKQFPYEQLPARQQDRKIRLAQGLVYQHGYHEFHIYYVKADEERTLLVLPAECEFDISGNNEDGFILTIQKVCDTKRNQERLLLNEKRRSMKMSLRTGERRLTEEEMLRESTMLTEEETSRESTILTEEETLTEEHMPSKKNILAGGKKS